VIKKYSCHIFFYIDVQIGKYLVDPKIAIEKDTLNKMKLKYNNFNRPWKEGSIVCVVCYNDILRCECKKGSNCFFIQYHLEPFCLGPLISTLQLQLKCYAEHFKNLCRYSTAVNFGNDNLTVAERHVYSSVIKID